MATYCALHVRTSDLARVVAELREWLASVAEAPVSVESEQPWPPVYDQLFRTGSTVPNLFAAAPQGATWIVAHFNCFSDLAELANRLSERLDTRVIVIHAQSVSDAYLLAVHENGVSRRVLEYGDRLTRNEGAPFEFEGEIFGVDDDELPPEDELTVGHAEVQEICARLGLSIWDQQEAVDPPDRWTVLRVSDDARVAQPGFFERLRRLRR